MILSLLKVTWLQRRRGKGRPAIKTKYATRYRLPQEVSEGLGRNLSQPYPLHLDPLRVSEYVQN
jgi:hypothetical protein